MPYLVCPSCPSAYATAAKLAAHRVLHPAPRVAPTPPVPVAKPARKKAA